MDTTYCIHLMDRCECIFLLMSGGTGASIPVIRWTALYGVSQKCALMYRQMKNLPNVKAPNAIFYKDLLWMFFSRFSLNSNRIFASVSEDGQTWSECRECEGLDSNGLQIYNPHVNIMEDGRLRLYFTNNTYTNGPVGAVIRSAVSSDGIHWTREEGVRIGPGKAYDRHGIFNVDIVPIDSGYRMYYTGYWGRHLLEPLTLHYYRKKLKKQFQKKNSMVGNFSSPPLTGSNNQDFRTLPSLWSHLSGKVVMDLGCGSGLYSHELLRRGAKAVVGIDLNRKALSELVKNSCRGLHLICADAEHLPFRDETFDMVLSVEVSDTYTARCTFSRFF